MVSDHLSKEPSRLLTAGRPAAIRAWIRTSAPHEYLAAFPCPPHQRVVTVLAPLFGMLEVGIEPDEDASARYLARQSAIALRPIA
jgi:hypothetical protein